MTSLRVGLAQMRSGVDPAANALAARKAIEAAAARGARFVATPEATNLIQRDSAKMLAALVDFDRDPTLAAARDAARQAGVVVLLGSVLVRSADGRAANRSVLIDAEGGIAATYDKIHLFDVTLGAGEAYAESRSVQPGDKAVLAQTPWGGLGLSVCYDLRFPALYRALAEAGATMIAVPAAFTRPTGEAHWEVLLRARAIEAGAFILAPAQGGVHEDGRGTWGRSTIVDPWGAIVAKLDHDEPTLLIADLDLAAVDAARAKIPSLAHARDFARP